MIPHEWLMGAVNSYEPGMENASEHDRNGAFHWWLKRTPSAAQLSLLAKLSYLDPDQIMASDVRDHIRRAANFTGAVEEVLSAAT